MKLIVQIPVLNEADTIAEVIHDIPRQIAGIDSVEVLVEYAHRRLHIERFHQNQAPQTLPTAMELTKSLLEHAASFRLVTRSAQVARFPLSTDPRRYVLWYPAPILKGRHFSQ